MAINTKQPFASRRKSQPSGVIDPATIEDKDDASIENEGAIKKPSTNMHATEPGPGNEAAGQTSKM